jgi:SecD/SecF fusion protein
VSDYFDRVERQMMRSVQDGARRSWRWPLRFDHLVPAAAILVVIAVFAVFIGVRGNNAAPTAGSGATVSVTFTATPLDPRAPLGPAVDRSVDVLRARLDSVFPGTQVSRSGDRVVVLARRTSGATRAQIIALAATGQLEMYDWEANALTANGTTVARELARQDPQALVISQGSATSAPGDPGADSLSLYDAVKLASQQRVRQSPSRAGPEFYAFGSPRSAACRIATRTEGGSATPGAHCLLLGPASNPQQLLTALPAGVPLSQAHVYGVPPGIAIVQAVDTNPDRPTNFGAPSAQFFVIRDHPVLSGNQIVNPRAGRDETGNADVQFGFTRAGQRVFQHATAAIARRGILLSGLAKTRDQHFAVVVDGRLITVPAIDFKMYPDGIPGQAGADVGGGFLTAQSAKTLATLLRFGALPVRLALG